MSGLRERADRPTSKYKTRLRRRLLVSAGTMRGPRSERIESVLSKLDHGRRFEQKGRRFARGNLLFHPGLSRGRGSADAVAAADAIAADFKRKETKENITETSAAGLLDQFFDADPGQLIDKDRPWHKQIDVSVSERLVETG